MAIVAFSAGLDLKLIFAVDSKQDESKKETGSWKPIDLFRSEHSASTISLIEDHLNAVA